MIELYKPTIEELGFRESLIADEKTMSYNHAWGGTIPFPKTEWEKWYHRWLEGSALQRFYRYLYDSKNKNFVGEVAFRTVSWL